MAYAFQHIMSTVLSPLRQVCHRRALARGAKRLCGRRSSTKDHKYAEFASDGDAGLTKILGELLCDDVLAQRVLSKLSPTQGQSLVALAQQAIRSCIDYATLGLGWDHPQARTAYWNAEGQSFASPASRRRRSKSRKAIIALINAMVSARKESDREALLATAFCAEIGFEVRKPTDVSFKAVAAALQADLLLPLRALREGLGDMTRTYSGMSIPRADLQSAVDAVTTSVLTGSFSEWRYNNPVGQEQLRGLSEKQIEIWREASISEHRGGLIVHEDAPGELGLFWATKIGGPSHGFDFGGQCLLPLLCNARHKVLLLSDPAHWPHPCGRAHLRLLWIADTEPSKPILWLEALNVDFAAEKAGLSTDGWQEVALRHLLDKADRMGVAASVDPRLGKGLEWIVSVREGVNQEQAESKVSGKVKEVRHRLVLRPSNGVVEASDYLSHKHDWVQMEEEITQPIHRVMYEPC